MAAKKGGLGKGLDAIFSENDMEDKNSAVAIKIGEIALSALTLTLHWKMR